MGFGEGPLWSCRRLIYFFFFNPRLRTCLLILEREEGEERERNINQLQSVCAPTRVSHSKPFVVGTQCSNRASWPGPDRQFLMFSHGGEQSEANSLSLDSYKGARHSYEGFALKTSSNSTCQRPHLLIPHWAVWFQHTCGRARAHKHSVHRVIQRIDTTFGLHIFQNRHLYCKCSL